jgi:DNA-binding MarR family transcriptional regulator
MTKPATEPAPQPAFDLQEFLPYLLNQAAEAASRGFQDIYRDTYSMTRTQWRVMANLGKFGAMTARDICTISHIEKTKVSRAVAHLEREGLLARSPSEKDRRAEILSLTEKGQTAFADLGQRALDYDRALRKELGAKTTKDLNRILLAIIATWPDAQASADD